MKREVLLMNLEARNGVLNMNSVIIVGKHSLFNWLKKFIYHLLFLVAYKKAGIANFIFLYTTESLLNRFIYRVYNSCS